jgi:DNA-binding response OmpR family regulator
MTRPGVKTILLVEDDEDLRSLLEKVLSEDYYVRSCGSATEALRRLHTERVHVVLTDLGLPDLGGEYLVRAAHGAMPPVPVVVMSGDRDRLEACRELADATLPKPCALPDMRAVVQRLARCCQGA